MSTMNPNVSRKHAPRLSTPVRTCVAAVAACFIAAPVLSNPVNPTVVSGSATFNQSGAVLTVTNSNGAIINWDKFSIKAGETTHFAQTSASSTVMNRVLLSEPSSIYGTLSSNGRVWLINPAGIMVGPGGRVDTAAFVASTLGVSNQDFLAGRKLFVNDGTAKDVINQGEIITPSGGSVYLIGANVSNETVAGVPNSGIITTPNGETILAAGNTVSLIDSALPGVKVDITGAAGNSTNLGTITAEAGRIGIAGVIVRNSGLLNASSVVNEGGRIFLKASQDAYVDKAGRIVTTGTRGGSVEVLGNRVAVMDNASIDASATSEGGDGGTIKVGGDYQGKNPDIQNASITYVGPDATLKADAGKVGAGGTVIVWADDTARAHGTISARGGAMGGDGGFVETSGHRYLDVAGARVDTRAPFGKTGNWLLDPTDIEIIHSANSLLALGGAVFDPGTGTSTTSDYDINAQFATTNVTIQTSAGTGGTGNITFDSTTAAILIAEGDGSPKSLILNADNDIIFTGANGTTFRASNSVGVLDVLLFAAGKVSTAAGSSVTLDGSGAFGQVQAFLPDGKAWDNWGTLTIDGNAAVHLGPTATFYNKSTGTVESSGTTGYDFYSGAAYGGVINNYGVININTTNAFEAAYSQSATGTLNIGNGKALALQNVLSLVGDNSADINLNATGVLEITESLGGTATFTNLSFAGTGGLLDFNAPGKTTNLSNVYAPNVTASLADGTINVVNGYAIFNQLGSDGGTIGAINNGTLALTNGSFTTFAGTTYSGNVGYLVSGGLTLPVSTPISTSGSFTLGAGWDGVSPLSAPVFTPGTGNLVLSSNVSSSGNLNLYAGGNIAFNEVTTSSAPWNVAHSITYAGTSSFTNTFYGGYLTSGNLNILAGGSVNITGTSYQTNVGSIGGGSTTVVSGWGGDVASPTVSVYGENGKDINLVNGQLFATGSGTINLNAGGKVNIAPTINAGYSGVSADTGNISITGNSIALKGGGVSGGGAGASIRSNSDQTFTVKGVGGGIGLTLEGLAVAGTYGGMASIETYGAGSSQVFQIDNGAPVVLKAGFGGFNPDGTSWCPANTCTNNSASIRNSGSGGQSFTFTGAGALTLYGGGVGNGNYAGINNKGSGLLEIIDAGTISLYNGTAGGYGGLANDGHENGADIGSNGSLSISAASIIMDATQGATYGGVFIGGPSISITTTGALTMTGGTGTDGGSLVQDAAIPANFMVMNPAAIGWDESGTTIDLDIGGTLTMTGGAMGLTAGSPVMIGGVAGVSATVDIIAGAFNSGSTGQFVSRIGTSGTGGVDIETTTGALGLGKSLIGLGSGEVWLTAYGGITQDALGRVRSDSLFAEAGTGGSGGISMPGVNRADYVDLEATGSISYNSYQSFYLVNATPGAAQPVAVTTVSGSAYGGDIFLGTVGVASSTVIDITAYGGIYDGNGSGTVNVSGGTVNLISHGGNEGDLAISADVKSSAMTNATVASGSSYGGIRIWAIDNLPGGNANLTDGATYQPSIGFYYGGSIANPSIFNLNAGTDGDLLFAAGGDLTGAPNIVAAPTNGKLILAAGGTLTMAASFGSPSYKLGLLGGNVEITAQVTGSEIAVGAGSLTVGSGGALVSAGALIGVVSGTANISDGGYIKSTTGDLELLVGGDLNISNGGYIHAGVGQTAPSYTPDASIAVGGDLKLNNGAYIKAANDVYLDMLGADSTLVLNDGTVGYSPSYILSDIGTGLPGTTHLTFLGRSEGGVIINGVATTTTVVGGSGLFAVNTSTPAAPGAGLNLVYAVAATADPGLTNALTEAAEDVAPDSTATDSDVPVIDTAQTGGSKPGEDPNLTAGGTDGGFGTETGDASGSGSSGTDGTTGDASGSGGTETGGATGDASGSGDSGTGDEAGNKEAKKDDTKDKKDKKSDQAKEEKKDEKRAAKKVAQCS